jgi:SAM-dependent MidA family methyltransferase
MASSLSSPSSAAGLTPAFAAAFLAASGPARTLRFDAFMRLALYHPELGYYRRERLRVARDRAADFYTATSLGPLFGELVAVACAALLRRAGLDPAAHTFVELGAEPTGGVLAAVESPPFAATRTVRVGEPLVLSGPCVVFSNELFDAQPVRRFVRESEAWHELGVALASDGAALVECDLGPVSDAELPLPPLAATPEGYLFDAPLAAGELAVALAKQPWRGLFVAFDYGKSFAELAHSVPVGTARAYYRHAQSADLLARPGEQDLTAHVCWDWLAEAFAPQAPAGAPPTVVSQESFFVHHASEHLAALLSSPGAAAHKRTLMHLLHPGHLGQKFQVLHALKT